MSETNEPVVETVPVVEVDNQLTIDTPEVDKTTLEAELAKGDLVAVESVVDVAEVSLTPEPVVEVVAEVNTTPPSDIEVQAALETIAPGAYFRTRCNLGPATDTFVVGGPFAPGRQRWVQTATYDSAETQAKAIRDALL